MARIYFADAGSPTPTHARFGTANILQLGDTNLMFDCGPAATHKMVKMGLFPTQVSDLFFTHHHFALARPGSKENAVADIAHHLMVKSSLQKK